MKILQPLAIFLCASCAPMAIATTPSRSRDRTGFGRFTDEVEAACGEVRDRFSSVVLVCC
jgi:hypothetical protein